MADLFASQTFVTLDDRPDIVAAYCEVPPVEDSFMPWVTILEQHETTGELRWEFGPDAVLVPVRQRAVEPDPKRRRLLRRRSDRSGARLR